MAERRMFAKTIIDSDSFLDMPLSAQSLYFHLAMRADDDGFVNNPKKIQRMIGASDDDCKLLVLKRFILTFESGVIVIKHWKIHNYIQKDRYKETVYLKEKSMLEINDNKAYKECIQNVYNTDTQVSIGKVSIGKYRDSQSINQDKDKQNNLIINSNEIKFYCEILDEWLDGNQDFTSSGKLIDMFERIKEVISNKEYVTINDCEVSIDKVLKRLVENCRLGYDKWEEILAEVDAKPIKNKPLYFLKSIYNAI